MPVTDLLLSQLTDPFRIGLVIALIATTIRTQAATGTVLPLAAGMAFIAVLIPVTMEAGSAEPLWRLIAVGLVANLVLLAAGMAVWQVVRRLRG